MEPSDEALIQACRRGDQAAWELLVERYQRLIYSIPRRAGLDEDLAADVFQRVFATLVQKLDKIEHPERIGAWLTTTARREVWRISRRERTVATLASADEELVDDIPDGALSPDELLVRLEDQHKVRVAVTTLNERCRRLLILLFYQAEPPAYTEIALMLGTSEGSIGPTRARCLQKLRRLLDAMGF
jgi:RNA polymerase sigma factor (sigma-70 family)